MKIKSFLSRKCQLFSIMTGLCLLVIIVGYYYYQNEAGKIRQEKTRYLNTISQLKIEQISNWYRDELHDARVISQNRFLGRLITAWFDSSTPDSQMLLNEYLHSLRREHDLKEVLIASPAGDLLLATNKTYQALHSFLVSEIKKAAQKNSTISTGLYRCDVHNMVHIDFLSPVFNENNKLLAIVVFQMDPRNHLYPLIRFLPVVSKTFETLIVRKDGNSVLFLNELRHLDDTALNLRIPLTEKKVSAVQAVLGHTGLWKGEDYRGVNVLSEINPVPGTPWFMIAKMDEKELLQELYPKIFYILLITLLLIFFIVTGLSLIYSYRQKNVYKQLWQYQEEFKVILYSIGDGVITTDSSGRIQHMNLVAQNLTGWGEKEAVGQNSENVFKVINEETHKAVENPFQQVLREGKIIDLANNSLLLSKNGKTTPVADSGAPIRDEKNVITGVVLVFRNQTEERLAQNALLKSEQQFKSVFEHSTVGYSLTLTDGRLYRVNESFSNMLGYTKQELLEKSLEDITHPDDLSKSRECVRAVLSGEKNSCKLEKRYFHRNGHAVWALMSTTLQRDRHNAPLYFITSIVDLTEHKNTVQSLRESEQRFSTLFYSNPIPASLTLVKNSTYTDVNDAWCEFMGFSKEEAIGYTPEELNIFDIETVNRLRNLYNREGTLKNIETTINTKRNGKKDILVSIENLQIGGEIYKINQIVDITDRNRQEKEYRQLIDGMNDTAFVINFDGKFIEINESAIKKLGYQRNELLSMGVTDLDPYLSSERIKALMQKIKSNARQIFETEHKTKNGEIIPVEISSSLISYQGKEAILSVARDISDRKLAEAERERLITAIEYAFEGIVITDPSGMIEYINPAFTKITGYSRKEAIGQNISILKSGEHDESFYKKLWNRISAGEFWSGRIINKRKDGSLFMEEMSISPVLDRTGKISYYVAVKRDITKEEELEQQIRQAQKMESVGRLAGGIAHDFNNMLSVILGYSEMALNDLEPSSKLYTLLEEIRKAGERSVTLTQQLLAFARKQTIAPRILNLNDTVSFMIKMLRRLIGENIDLDWEPGANLWPVKMDPVQVDQILANLCVNARDAIKGQGKVTIETENVRLEKKYSDVHADVKPGSYVMLAVSDDGCGMDKEILGKIFEPFFTTKDVGKGTGLGLSTVYGIVKQNHGFINVYSEPENGTTFKIYIPRNPEISEESGSEVSTETLRSRGERILVVEDEIEVLRMTQSMLERLGYAVLTATTPREALDITEQQKQEIHLLITDVVMPAMDGKELAAKILEYIPDIRTLYMSGYTFDTIAHRGILPANVHFIQKPFSLPRLASKVREILKTRP
ncbi:MAG: PAS domain S-box protein [Desulfobia sp.]